MENIQLKTILLVESDALTVEADAETIRSFGYQVITANSGEKAVEIARLGLPLSLVLLDIELGSPLDGAQAAQQILDNREVPIVFFTPHLEKEMVERVRGIPRYGYIPRNSGEFFLQSSIENALELFGQRQSLLLSEKYLDQIASVLHEAIWLTDVKTRQVLYVNPAFEQLSGLTRQEFYKNPSAFINTVHPEDRPRIREGVLYRFDIYRIVRPDGSIRWVWGRTFPVKNEDGKNYRTATIVEDITEKRLTEEELRFSNDRLETQMEEIQRLQSSLRDQAIRDPLTGLYNRRYLNETLDRELARALREGYPVSLVMIDIDSFKQVNDTYGHYAGDLVLKNLAQQLTNQTRASDLVCRLGGDEFLLVFPNVAASIALERAEQCRKIFQETATGFEQLEIRATLSLGIAMFPDQGDNSLAVLTAADRAMYQAKARRGNCVIAL